MKEATAIPIIKELLSIGAIQLRPEAPFKWSSGWNSPIYCDNRYALSFPELRTQIKNALVENVTEHFPDVEAVAGVATAGIPMGVLIADVLNLPFLYVRPKPKDHGMQNHIEGKVIPGQKVLVMEDLISTGESSLKAIDALQKASLSVSGIVAIFTYGFEISKSNFSAAGIPILTICDYNILMQVCKTDNMFSEQEMESLESWRLAPDKWKV